MMNSQRHRRRILRTALFLCFVARITSFSVSPYNRYNRQRVQCRETSDEEDKDAATMSTALCVVPPDEAWDTIQRARHMARDRTYHKWPPAIRLFHPFCPRAQLSNKALEIAQVVEDYDIEPFAVNLNSWTIVPHMEAIEADWEAMKQLPTQEKEVIREREETEVDRLIAAEERAGRERLRQRSRRRKKNKPEAYVKTSVEQQQAEELESKQDSPRELLKKQARLYEEFNGPCVLCLEPDEDSRERLVQLRELLKTELFDGYDKFSPSSSVSSTNSLPRAVLEAQETSFRPIVPVGNFPTVTSAVEMARKLKGLWDPLPFNVTDFQLISYEDDVSSPENMFDELSDSSGAQFSAQFNLKMTSWRQADIEEETLTNQGQFGCDALVMLKGQEIDTDKEASKEMVDILMAQGTPGGYELEEEELPNDEPLPSTSTKESYDDVEDLELWLDADDEYDEGAVIVIGRTHFFTGEMRTYTGMPASSAMDAKDRVLGEGTHASARRKGTSHRIAGSGLWKEGEFGQRESDHA